MQAKQSTKLCLNEPRREASRHIIVPAPPFKNDGLHRHAPGAAAAKGNMD
jgi:hypothetical protein